MGYLLKNKKIPDGDRNEMVLLDLSGREFGLKIHFRLSFT